MFDELTLFGTMEVKGATAEAAVSANAEHEIDLRVAAKEEDLEKLRIVFIALNADVPSATFTLKEGDSVENMAAVRTETLTDMKKGASYKVPFPLEHKRYMSISVSSNTNATFYSALEFGA